MTDLTAFKHKPPQKELKQAFISPVEAKELWDKVWAAAKSQPWYENDLGLVGGSTETGRFYFQKWGVKSGFAMVEVECTQ
jgi:hypothetical protein